MTKMTHREAANAEDCWISHYGADRTIPSHLGRDCYEDRLGNDLIEQYDYPAERAFEIAAEWMSANVVGGF